MTHTNNQVYPSQASSSPQSVRQRQTVPCKDSHISSQNRTELAHRTRGLLQDNSISRGETKVKSDLRALAQPYVARPRPLTDSLKAKAGAWSPVLTRDAATPVALLVFHHVCYFLMSQKGEALRNSAKDSVGRSLSLQMAMFIAQWAMAEIFRLAVDPAVANWQNAAGENALNYAKKIHKNDIQSWAVHSVRDEINASVGARAAEDTKTAVQNLTKTIDNLMGVTVAALPLALGAGVGSFTGAAVLSVLAGVLPNVLGVTAGTLTLFARQSKQSELTKSEHEAETRVRELTRNYADNIMIPNSLNQAFYEQALSNAIDERDKCSEKRARYKFISEVLLTLLNGVSLMGLHAYKVKDMDISAMSDKEVAWLPTKLFQLNKLSHKSIALGNDLTTLMQNQDNLRTLKASFDKLNHEEWRNRLTQMFSNKENFRIVNPKGQNVSLEEMLASTALLHEPGRWTIRAKNGSGKSTLLNTIMGVMGSQAHYIPVKHELHHTSRKGSAAETQIGQLAEVFDKVKASAILLDEWPANLDLRNTREIDEILGEASKTFCIVEIRND